MEEISFVLSHQYHPMFIVVNMTICWKHYYERFIGIYVLKFWMIAAIKYNDSKSYQP